MTLPTTFAREVIDAPAREQSERFLDEHRTALREALTGLSEQEARRSLVPSATTLLGLVKHATYVEKVWFDQALTGRTRAEIGIPEQSEDSFLLTDEDSVASVVQGHREACPAATRAPAHRGLADVRTGSRLGPRPRRGGPLPGRRALAPHCGHADILREQVLASRSAG